MTSALSTQPNAAVVTRFSNSPDILTDIYQDTVNMAVWQREPDAALDNECAIILADKHFTGYMATLSCDAMTLDESLTALAPYPTLRADIHKLVDMFICLFEVNTLGLRLRPLNKAMCPKFHVDRVPCRLISTYAGPGTQWLPHAQVDRSKLGMGSGGLSDDISGLYPSHKAIQSLQAGDVALLKGETWEGNEGAGLVHRSPTIDGGEQRLVLTLDFV